MNGVKVVINQSRSCLSIFFFFDWGVNIQYMYGIIFFLFFLLVKDRPCVLMWVLAQFHLFDGK